MGGENTVFYYLPNSFYSPENLSSHIPKTYISLKIGDRSPNSLEKIRKTHILDITIKSVEVVVVVILLTMYCDVCDLRVPMRGQPVTYGSIGGYF